jgi:hypothetical protein
VSIHQRLAEALRQLDLDTTGGDLSSRSSTSVEDWADALLELPGVAIIDTTNIDAIAKAMYDVRGRTIPWDDLSDVGWKVEYRRMAQAALRAGKES